MFSINQTGRSSFELHQNQCKSAVIHLECEICSFSSIRSSWSLLKRCSFHRFRNCSPSYPKNRSHTWLNFQVPRYLDKIKSWPLFACKDYWKFYLYRYSRRAPWLKSFCTRKTLRNWLTLYRCLQFSPSSQGKLLEAPSLFVLSISQDHSRLFLLRYRW